MMYFRMDVVCHGVTGVNLGVKVFIILLSCTDVHNETHTVSALCMCSPVQYLDSALAVY